MNDYFFDFDGNPITVEEFGRLWQGDRRIAENEVDGKVLKTMWLGMVDPGICCARLYGTALFTDGQPKQLQLYDSKEEALAGHAAHLAAMEMGLHCHRCQEGKPHDD